MIFTTKNKEFAILGNSIDEIKKKWSEFVTTIGKKGLFGENGAFASLFSGKKSNNILTPEVLTQFDEFKEKFNSSSLSAEALAEQMENVDQKIIDYAKTCKNGEMTTEGFKTSIENMSFSAKAGKVALQALATVGNMVLFAFISKGIELAVTSLDKFINATKHASENAVVLSSTMNNSINSMSDNASNLSDLNNEYQKLSQGVNRLGENVSLSTDDYSRYKDIISQISAIMPNLTTYFNAQGEKIVFAKGELFDLNKEYDKYIQRQAVKYVSEGDGEGHKIQDILDNYNQYDNLNDFQKFWSGLKTSLGFVDEKNFTSKEIINELEKLKTKDSVQELYEYLISYDKNFYGKPNLYKRDSAIKYWLLNELGLSGKDKSEILAMTEADYNALMQNIIAYIDDYSAKITSDMNSVRTSLLMQAYSKNDYWELEDQDIQNDIISFLSSIDSDVWEALGIKTEHDASKFVNNIITSMSNNTGGFADAWNNLFNPELTKLSPEEYVKQLNNLHISIEIRIDCNVYPYLCLYIRHIKIF